MSIFSKLFGGVDKSALTRDLVRLRIRSDPMAAAMGFDETMADSISGLQLAGVPEATIATIVDTWVTLHKRGTADTEIFGRIETHRSRMFPQGKLPSPLNLITYVKYRVRLEHPTGTGLSDSFIEAAVEVSRKAFAG